MLENSKSRSESRSPSKSQNNMSLDEKNLWKVESRRLDLENAPHLNYCQTQAMIAALQPKKSQKTEKDEEYSLSLLGGEFLFRESGPDDEEGLWFWDLLTYVFPILTWGPVWWRSSLRWSSLRADVMAGLTVGIMAIPQGMSYADIAGLPYIYGLYSIFVTCLVYGFTGHSRQLAVGPTALICLIVEAGLSDLMTEEDCPAYFNDNLFGKTQGEMCPGVYRELVFSCALLVGVLNLAGGLLNLGFLVNFLAHPVISGFTSGAAIIIGLSQVKYLFGFDLEKSQYVYVTVGQIMEKIGDINFITFGLGTFSLLSIGFLSYASKHWQSWKWLRPFGNLILCVMGILLMYFVPELNKEYDVSIVKDIPEGVPPISIGEWKVSRFQTVLSTAVSASVIGYLESVSIGKAIAAKNRYTLDAGGEMVALGMINFIGAAFSCCPVTGSFSRSAVNDSTGAQTQIAGFVTSVVMFLTLMVLTPLFYHLPKFALAAIVINSVKNLVAYEEAQHLWKVKRSDCMLWFCSFIGTLFLGIQIGIGVAIVLSLLVILHDTVRPQIVILWRLPHTHVYSSIKTTCQGVFVPGVLVLKVMGSVYFANSRYLQDKIHEIINAVEAKKADKIKFVIISLAACTAVDTSGVHAFHELDKSLKKEKRHLCFAQVGNRVWRTFVLSGFADSLGEEWVHESCYDATQHCLGYDSSHVTWEHHRTSLEKIQKEERYHWRRHSTHLASRSDSNIIQLASLNDAT